MSKFKKALVLDWETTGIPNPYANEQFLVGPQGIQLGVCVVDDTEYSWEVVDEFNATIRWLGPDPEVSTEPMLPELTWSEEAFNIHGLSRPFLRNKPTPEDLAGAVRGLLVKHFGKYNPIVLAGHNPQFDKYFTLQFMLLSNLLSDPEIVFSHRMLDSFTAGYITMGCTTSDELFKLVSGADRGAHNALEDARLTVDAFRSIVQGLKD